MARGKRSVVFLSIIREFYPRVKVFLAKIKKRLALWNKSVKSFLQTILQWYTPSFIVSRVATEYKSHLKGVRTCDVVNKWICLQQNRATRRG